MTPPCNLIRVRQGPGRDAAPVAPLLCATMFTPPRAAPRHSFLAPIQITGVESEKQLAAHTKDLNLFGALWKQ